MQNMEILPTSENEIPSSKSELESNFSKLNYVNKI